MGWIVLKLYSNRNWQIFSGSIAKLQLVMTSEQSPAGKRIKTVGYEMVELHGSCVP